MVFSWFKSEQRERRRKVKLDRKHLEAKSRRFLKNYLNADETRKPQYYRAVEEASKQCQPAGSGFPLKASGNGSMHTGRSLASGDRISIKIRRIWHRSTAKNMPLITARRKLNTRDRI